MKSGYISLSTDYPIYDYYNDVMVTTVCNNTDNHPIKPSEQPLVSFSAYDYSFNPDVYESSIIIPRNVFYIKRGKSDPGESLSVNMPHWKHTTLSPNSHKDFILKYFPDKWNLYKSFDNKEEQDNLIVYLWLYLNGGVYINSDYELIKSLEPILDSMPKVDVYLMYDDERYISPKFLVSQPFCSFWMEVIDLMDKRKNHKYPTIREKIDRNTGRGLLTDVVETTTVKYLVIPRNHLDPYGSCDIEFTKDSCLRPSNRVNDVITSLSCSTGTSNELLYVTSVSIFIFFIMIIIALITR